MLFWSQEPCDGMKLSKSTPNTNESKFNYGTFHFRRSLIWKWHKLRRLCWTVLNTSPDKSEGSEKEGREGGKREAKPCGRQLESRQLVSAVAQSDLTLWKNVVGSRNCVKSTFRERWLAICMHSSVQGYSKYSEVKMMPPRRALLVDTPSYVVTNRLCLHVGRLHDKGIWRGQAATVNHSRSCARVARISPCPHLPLLASRRAHNEKNGAVSHIASANSIFCFISHT